MKTYSEDLLKTDLILSEEFRNKQKGMPCYKIEAPDGQSIFLRQNLSKGCKLRMMLLHLGATIEENPEDREVRGLSIAGVELTQIEPNILRYESSDKRTAANRYLAIKAELRTMGVEIVDYVCYPYKMKKTEKSCLEDTLKAFVTE